MKAKTFMLESTNHFKSDVVAWLRPDAVKVTTDIARAGTYTQAEAEKIAKTTPVIIWPVESVLTGEAGNLGRTATRRQVN